MSTFVIVDKKSLNEISVDASNINLKAPSNIHTKLYRDDVAEFIQDGNNLILKLKNGKTITIANFFVKQNDEESELVFEDEDCGLPWLPFLLGGAGVAGAIAAVASDNGGDKNTTYPEIPTEQSITPTVTVTGYEDNVGKIVGNVKSGEATDDNKPVISGTATNAKTVEVTIKDASGKVVFTKIVNVEKDGSWKLPELTEAEQLADGNYIITATATSSTGKEVSSNEYIVTVDTTPPQAEITIGEDGKITITYPKDVDPDTIKTKEITVTDKEGNPIDAGLIGPDENGVVTGKVPSGVDGEVVVTVPEGSYEDTTGNPGLLVEEMGTINNTVIATAELLEVVEDTVATGNIDGKDANNKELTYTVITKPNHGMVDMDPKTGAYRYTPKENISGEDSFTVMISNSDGNKTTVDVKVNIEAVADAPEITLPSLDFDIGELALNKYVWKDINGKVTIDGKVYNFDGKAAGGNGEGNGINENTLVNGINALLANKDHFRYKPSEEGQTTTLKDPDIAAGTAVLINGLVYLEAGKTYTYSGTVDDSGKIIIGNGLASYFTTWDTRASSGQEMTFTVSETGFYDFNLYIHNESNLGNYNFKVVEADGTPNGKNVKYYPNIDAINKDLPDYAKLDDSKRTDSIDSHYGIKYGYSGYETDKIILEGMAAKLTDTDGSETLAISMSGLPAGTIVTFISVGKDEPIRLVAGTNGDVSYEGESGEVEFKDFELQLPEGADVGSNTITVDISTTEESNGDSKSESFEFDITVKESDVSTVVSLPEMLINQGSGASTTTMQVNPDKIANIEVISSVDKGAFPGFSFKDNNGKIVMDESGNVVIKGSFGADILPEIRITGKDGSVEIIKINSPEVNDELIGSAKPKEDTNDDFTYKVTGKPKNGTVELNEETGEYVYRPNLGYEGKDTFVITVYDANGDIATHESGHPMLTTVPILVVAANNTPDTMPAAYRAMMDTIDEIGTDSTDEEIIPTVASNESVLYQLLSGLENDNTGGHGIDTWVDFALGNPELDDNADVLKFSEDFFEGLTLDDLISKDSETVGKFITVDYDEASQTATISVDRDGEGSGYTSETLLHLTNQDNRITLDDLLENNQVIIG